ncbi:MAG: MFS transporter [Anaerolineae bacterium]|nr:MFS transporter [Anaerolineae bacterium]
METANPARRQAPIRIDIFYSLITLGSTAIWSVMSGWLLYFYLPPAGEGQVLVPAALYGVTTLAVRALNALFAIWVGHRSDRIRSRWGRRLPLIFVSALPMLLFFVLLWIPPVRGESGWNLAYLALILILYNGAYSLNQIPFTALLPDLALTDSHRVRMSAWSASAFLLGFILGGLAGPLIDRGGYLVMALIYVGIALPLFYLPFLVLRERPRPPAAEMAADRPDLWRALGSMRHNRPFVIMTAAGVCYWGITTLVQATLPYIVTEICRLDTGDAFYFYIPAVLASLVCYPLITWLSNRVGKWAVFAGSMLASAIVLPGLLLIGERLPLGLGAQGILWMTLQAVALSGVAMLPPAFGAEIVDYDEQLTGQRREGLYYSVWGLLDQVVNGLVAALLPVILLLGRSRGDPNGPLGVRMVGMFGGALMLVGFLVFLNYPLRQKGEVE